MFNIVIIICGMASSLVRTTILELSKSPLNVSHVTTHYCTVLFQKAKKQFNMYITAGQQVPRREMTRPQGIDSGSHHTQWSLMDRPPVGLL